MSLFFFTPFPVSLYATTVVAGARPVQLPLGVLLAGDLPRLQLPATLKPLSQETIQQRIVESNAHPLLREIRIRVVHHIQQTQTDPLFLQLEGLNMMSSAA